MSPWLYLKSRVVPTVLGGIAKDLRWHFSAIHRHKHPELWELSLEERRLPIVLKRLMTPTACGVDVGCHIGSFLTLLLKYAPEGQHVAFEASVAKSRWLKERFPTVKIIQSAVSDVSGKAIFEENVERPGYSRLRDVDSGREEALVEYEVPTARLDNLLLSAKSVDLIKLDIEGGEMAALRGATGVIEKWRPVIIFECGTEEFLEQHGLSRRELYNFITGCLGYRIFCFTDFLFDKGAMSFDEFRKCGLYPFRAFNFVALPLSDGAPRSHHSL